MLRVLRLQCIAKPNTVLNTATKIHNMLLLQIAALFTRAQLAFIAGGRCHGLLLIVLR